MSDETPDRVAAQQRAALQVGARPAGAGAVAFEVAGAGVDDHGVAVGAAAGAQPVGHDRLGQRHQGVGLAGPVAVGQVLGNVAGALVVVVGRSRGDAARAVMAGVVVAGVVVAGVVVVVS